MKIETTQENSVTIFRLTEGNRFNAIHSGMIKEKLNEVLTTPSSRLIIDFEEINFIDSSGFGALLSALKTSKENQSSLKLCNINTDVMELIELMQLDTIFDIQQDVPACLNSFIYRD
ncbi:MAG: STAS domain-containing protein [Marinifilaceae bacterium]